MSRPTNVNEQEGGKVAHWISESGVMEVYVLVGATPKEVLTKYARLTGFPQMPPAFATGHHQSRWNYNSQDDVKAINDELIKWNTPTDVIWLDIEHTDGKRYFTWDSYHFSNPSDMVSYVASFGRKIVTIVDPHIKNDANYYINSDIDARDLWVRTRDGEVYTGWCWPGESRYPDFSNPTMRQFWAEQFRFDKYQHSSSNLFIWNDMNEPSVFNGPEVTMPKSCRHVDGWEHRDLHNLYGYFVHWATFDGLLLRSNHAIRPFVLSRSFFAGSQRFGAIWTGDNTADWKHLKISVPMLLSMSIAGLPFVGADIGGFFNNPTPELMARWYELATFYPFFRNHAHQDTKRRELWEFDDVFAQRMRNAIVQRYQLFPYVYTLFHLSATTGEPIMRPLWFDLDRDSSASTLTGDDAFMFGPALLVQGIYEPDVTDVVVSLPGNKTHVWYEWREREAKEQHLYSGGEQVRLFGYAQGIPVLQLGGTIVATALRIRRSTELMKRDPLSLVVALDKYGLSKGLVYIDDGTSFDFQNGAYLKAEIQVQNCQLFNTVIHNKYTVPGSGHFIEKFTILGSLQPLERIEILSQGKQHNLNKDFFHQHQFSLIIKTMPLHLSLYDNFQVHLISKNKGSCLK
ncbi:neutral alpha-glucosidase AB precursor [Reticulomyxa filosa]|uniref:Neutral alpha-glucosidase AB n=1 Tax=Reticulomyxa filosa TaxID=46433 RepID=X6NFN6_RETFI|nr:neutral alpha-glucosidase AB precursor [Reticulomyxa filosa]|eukprot:ETO25135.1 neutral alpha-glucosidase AB precursor [Reticulomyxa filosa]